MASVQLSLKTYRQEGDLAHEYNPLHNMIDQNNKIIDFNTDELNIDLNNPLNIECQPSYDGTVNLIINDDKNPPRIINSRFSKIEDNRYKIINRNQIEQTNLYRVGKIDQQTRLFRNINNIPRIDLLNVHNTGQLKGGNYTFYIKFADNDYNKTDIVCESGQVSIFNGYLNKIPSISGALLDELTDKAVTLKISNIDTSFSRFYLYFTRETGDLNGVRITKAGMFTTPFDIKDSVETITINGYEEIQEISVEELNIKYNLVTAAKTQAQVQNMLFLGNVQGITHNIRDLQNIAYFLKVTLKQDSESVGWISPQDYTVKNNDSINQVEYYSPYNIYYKLGYWPDEIYRLGIVFIMNDDSLSPVFNLRGCEFIGLNDDNLIGRTDTTLFTDNKMNYITRDDFLSKGRFLDNTFGVFKNPSLDVINYSSSEVNPIYYQITISEEIAELLSTKYNVKGYFIVRQKRIPTTICQGFSIGVDRSSYVPMIYDNHNANDAAYVTEGFLSSSRLLTQTFKDRVKKTPSKQCSGLLSLDPCVNKLLQSSFDGTEFILKPTKSNIGTISNSDRHYYLTGVTGTDPKRQISTPLVFINSNTPLKYVNGYSYSTRCGVQEDISQFSFFKSTDYSETNDNLLRGVYCPFLGAGTSLQNNTIYDIKIPNYSTAKIKDYFSIRGKDNAPFFAVSDRYQLNLNSDINISVFRGDCYSETVTIRMNRNFVDSDVPVNELIINPSTWKDNYRGYMNTINKENTEDDKKGNFANINRADVNTVNLGHWITFKCLSNYNLGLRSDDRTHTDEFALMGSPRSFYPHSDMSVVVSNKVEESWLLNDGYDSTVGVKRNFLAENVPYVKELFDNRVMFSNVQQDDDFKNAYRIFQGLSYKDIDRQYGAIVKFIPWGVNILCIFEHGIGLIPINEKALLQTNSGQSIHMYGAGVLQNQISLISADFGSIWPESIIRTPIGVYGVDTYAKKIWRYSDGKGLEIISDMRVQQFLNNNIKLSEQDKYPIIGIKNVKSHYNNNKGDIMFTFYNIDGAVNYKTNPENGSEVIINGLDTHNTWNLCFNERLDKWITRYSWTPLYSENINNIFYSLDQNRAKILGYIYNNKHCTYGLRSTNNKWNVNSTSSSFSSTLTVNGYTLADSYSFKIDSIETSYLNNNNEEIQVLIENSNIINSLFNNAGSSKPYSIFQNHFSTTNYVGITHVPVWYKLNLTITLNIGTAKTEIKDVLGIVLDGTLINNKIKNTFLRNGFYVHGRAGIFNELKYEDESFENQILPTKWYDKQEPFEFEFVVNAETGLHKIFDNLVIISNNVQPDEIEYEIEGDIYDFNKSGIYRSMLFDKDSEKTSSTDEAHGDFDPTGTHIRDREWNYCPIKELIIDNNNNPYRQYLNKRYKTTQRFLNCNLDWDTTLNSYSLILKQKCKNIYSYGRRIGNIQYREGQWILNIEPILFKDKHRFYNIDGTFISGSEDNWSRIKSTRIRDKYCKIRVKYTGEDLVIITALKTLYTQSYA